MDRSLQQHAFDADEIMAYLDGELEPRRAGALAAHLVSCGECQEMAQGFRAISERMMNFEVEPAPMRISDAVLKAGKAAGVRLPAGTGQWPWWNRRRLFRKPYAWAFACWIALLFSWGLSTFHRSRGLSELVAERTTGLSAPPRAFSNSVPKRRLSSSELALPASQSAESSDATDQTGAPAPPASGELQAPETVGPMIAQTASLSIVATNYDEASAAIERLAAAHGGYVEKLTAKAQTGSARELSSALRIPAKQLDGFLVDLRKLGHVEEESRQNQEVSAQYVDLQARLKSARATEQRLIELLGTRTGKLSDVLDAERELARIRGEIESMQGQNAILVHRVSYATVQVELSEEYRERLSTTSKRTKIWNALVEGFRNLEDGALAGLIFLLAYGPSTLFWLAILLLPAWLIGRRLRRPART